ncbi:MAG: hypothetical protein JNK29_19760 [Anaerolineales bacterium]|nr:hypothetical protein [Anaerolineales bacterium]
MNLSELQTYVRIVVKRLPLIGLLMAVTIGTILLAAYFAKPVYRATTSFQVTTPLPNEVSLVNEFRTSTSREELAYTRNNFLAVLQSEFVVGQVISKLGLQVEPDELLQQVVIEADPNSDFVKLQVTAESSELAASIANSLVDTASSYFGELSSASVTANKQVILELQAERKAQLDAATAALLKFQAEHNIGSLEGLLTLQERLIATAKENRDQALAEGKTAEAAKYEAIIANREQELQVRVQLSAQYEELISNAKRLDSAYGALLDKETEAELKEREIVSARFIRAIPARAPLKPLPNLDFRVLILGGAASLALGVILAFSLEYLAVSRKADPLAEAKARTMLQASWGPGKD